MSGLEYGRVKYTCEVPPKKPSFPVIYKNVAAGNGTWEIRVGVPLKDKDDRYIQCNPEEPLATYYFPKGGKNEGLVESPRVRGRLISTRQFEDYKNEKKPGSGTEEIEGYIKEIEETTIPSGAQEGVNYYREDGDQKISLLSRNEVDLTGACNSCPEKAPSFSELVSQVNQAINSLRSGDKGALDKALSVRALLIDVIFREVKPAEEVFDTYSQKVRKEEKPLTEAQSTELLKLEEWLSDLIDTVRSK